MIIYLFSIYDYWAFIYMFTPKKEGFIGTAKGLLFICLIVINSHSSLSFIWDGQVQWNLGKGVKDGGDDKICDYCVSLVTKYSGLFPLGFHSTITCPHSYLKLHNAKTLRCSQKRHFINELFFRFLWIFSRFIDFLKRQSYRPADLFCSGVWVPVCVKEHALN